MYRFDLLLDVNFPSNFSGDVTDNKLQNGLSRITVITRLSGEEFESIKSYVRKLDKLDIDIPDANKHLFLEYLGAIPKFKYVYEFRDHKFSILSSKHFSDRCKLDLVRRSEDDKHFDVVTPKNVKSFKVSGVVEDMDTYFVRLPEIAGILDIPGRIVENYKESPQYKSSKTEIVRLENYDGPNINSDYVKYLLCLVPCYRVKISGRTFYVNRIVENVKIESVEKTYIRNADWKMSVMYYTGEYCEKLIGVKYRIGGGHEMYDYVGKNEEIRDGWFYSELYEVYMKLEILELFDVDNIGGYGVRGVVDLMILDNGMKYKKRKFKKYIGDGEVNVYEYDKDGIDISMLDKEVDGDEVKIMSNIGKVGKNECVWSVELMEGCKCKVFWKFEEDIVHEGDMVYVMGLNSLVRVIERFVEV